jgi:cystathionine gamma-synthase
MRGLKTLALRVERQNQSALLLAKALEQHPKVERVHYPWLESHPSYAIAKAQMQGGGAVVSFVVRGGRAAASRVVDAARIPQIAASLGGVESLIEQPAIMSFFELNDDELDKIGINPALIRLSVGIEDSADLVTDLLAALDHA